MWRLTLPASQLAGDSKENCKELGHISVTITLDFVPFINAQLGKEQPGWPLLQEWRRVGLSLAQGQANPAQVKLGRVWSKKARLAFLRGVCLTLPCRCGLGETQRRLVQL